MLLVISGDRGHRGDTEVAEARDEGLVDVGHGLRPNRDQVVDGRFEADGRIEPAEAEEGDAPAERVRHVAQPEPVEDERIGAHNG